MNSKEKDNTMSKLKQFFKSSRNNGKMKKKTFLLFLIRPTEQSIILLLSKIYFFSAVGIRDDSYPESIERELNSLLPDNTVQQRCRSLNELSKYVANTKLEEVSLNGFLEM